MINLIYYKFGLSDEILSKFDIVFIPDNFHTDTEISNLHYSHDAVDLIKEMKGTELKIGGPTELDFPKKYFERRNDNYWLGEIYIVSSIVLPVATKLIANFIQKKIDSHKSKNANKSSCNINVKLRMNKDGKMNSIEYEGDAESFIKIIDTLK